MRAFPSNMGRGSFIWEPADYPAVNATGTLFTLTGKVYATNSAMTAYPTLAKSYGLPVPSGVVTPAGRKVVGDVEHPVSSPPVMSRPALSRPVLSKLMLSRPVLSRPLVSMYCPPYPRLRCILGGAASSAALLAGTLPIPI